MNHSDSSQHETAKYSFIDGYITAQQSQPMWREIEGDVIYEETIFKNADGNITYYSARGRNIIELGYTHYLSSDDLLKLPTLTKTTPQERG